MKITLKVLLLILLAVLITPSNTQDYKQCVLITSRIRPIFGILNPAIKERTINIASRFLNNKVPYVPVVVYVALLTKILDTEVTGEVACKNAHDELKNFLRERFQCFTVCTDEILKLSIVSILELIMTCKNNLRCYRTTITDLATKFKSCLFRCARGDMVLYRLLDQVKEDVVEKVTINSIRYDASLMRITEESTPIETHVYENNKNTPVVEEIKGEYKKESSYDFSRNWNTSGVTLPEGTKIFANIQLPYVLNGVFKLTPVTKYEETTGVATFIGKMDFFKGKLTIPERSKVYGGANEVVDSLQIPYSASITVYYTNGRSRTLSINSVFVGDFFKSVTYDVSEAI